MCQCVSPAEVEAAALYYLDSLGYTCLHGSDIAPSEPSAERDSYSDVILTDRLRTALTRLNPQVPLDAIDEALRQVIRSESQNLIENNRRFHKLLTDGIPVTYQRDDRRVNDLVWLIDFDQPHNNDWLAVNQFTVLEHQNRRPDIVLFLNG
ncbi:MAG: type I restriction endonuclease, partial [Cyanobacteria bacterium J06659_2]